MALSFTAQITRSERVCAWIDVSDALEPEAAAANGVDLARLLWVRCGVADTMPEIPRKEFSLPPECLVPKEAKRGLHGGGFRAHPRQAMKGVAEEIGRLFRPEDQTLSRQVLPGSPAQQLAPSAHGSRRVQANSRRPWSRMEQALHATDLLLQAGGFSAIVLDMGGVTPEFVSRVPLATWFRYRAAAERTQASVLLLTQHPCAKSAAELVVQMQPGHVIHPSSTVFHGMEHRAEVARQRFTAPAEKVVPMRRPVQRETATTWQNRMTWAGVR